MAKSSNLECEIASLRVVDKLLTLLQASKERIWKGFFIALLSIVVVLLVAVIGAHFYGLQNLSAYQFDRFTTAYAYE